MGREVKIERIVLCYSDMDRIIVAKEEHLSRFDLRKVSYIEYTTSMTPEEFAKFREQYPDKLNARS